MEQERPDVVPLAVAAELLQISTEAVRKRIQRGTLPGRKVDGAWFVEASALPSSSSGRQDVPAGRPDDVQDVVLDDDNGVRTVVGVAPDMAPLAELIDSLTRQNQELAAAAAVWQYRALRAEERVEALEAGPIEPPDASDVHEHAPQDANTVSLRGDAPQMTTVALDEARGVPKPASESLALGWRRWLRRMIGSR